MSTTRFLFFFNDTATTEIYPLSLHDALPISMISHVFDNRASRRRDTRAHEYPCGERRSEEHTSELQSPCNLVCRLLLEKKKKEHRRRPSRGDGSASPHGAADRRHPITLLLLT